MLGLETSGVKRKYNIFQDPFSRVAYSGRFSDLQEFPEVSVVGKTGRYRDLVGAPSKLFGTVSVELQEGAPKASARVVHGLGTERYFFGAIPQASETKLLVSIEDKAADSFTLCVRPVSSVFPSSETVSLDYFVYGL